MNATSRPRAAPPAGPATAPAGGRLPWRAGGAILTSLGTPAGIWVADPLMGQVTAGIEVAVALTIVITALFGSQALSDRAFRLLRWIANQPEPAAPATTLPRPRRSRS